jgi:hypothetical protein
MQTSHEINAAACRLIGLLDGLATRGFDEFHPAYEELEREYAELRLQFSNAQ